MLLRDISQQLITEQVKLFIKYSPDAKEAETTHTDLTAKLVQAYLTAHFY